MWKHLLVPHDFSLCAARALRTAIDLAKVHGAELMLAHVTALPANLAPDTLVSPAGVVEPLRVDEYTTRGARQQLEIIAEPLRREGLVVHTRAGRHTLQASVSIAPLRGRNGCWCSQTAKFRLRSL